jgi:hypothetical protein
LYSPALIIFLTNENRKPGFDNQPISKLISGIVVEEKITVPPVLILCHFFVFLYFLLPYSKMNHFYRGVGIGIAVIILIFISIANAQTLQYEVWLSISFLIQPNKH